MSKDGTGGVAPWPYGGMDAPFKMEGMSGRLVSFS